MSAHNIITIPYQVARTPLALFDVKVVHRLPPDSPGRQVFDRAFGSLDLLVGQVLRDDSLKRQGAERLGRSDQATTDAAMERAAEEAREAAEEEVARKQAEASKARAGAVKAKQRRAARGNQKLSTIRQELEVTDAIAEAREHQAEERAEEQVEEAVHEAVQEAARDERGE